jgi:RHS repeat-associated protein
MLTVLKFRFRIPFFEALRILLAVWFSLSPAANAAFLQQHHHDPIALNGSTLARTDDSGNVIGRAAYSAYGLTTFSEDDMATPFRYNGQAGVQTDPNGLLNMRARYYSPYLMRFLNADPIGFSGGSNWFVYADGNPISKSDPFGLVTIGFGTQVGGGAGLGLTGSEGIYVGKSGWNPFTGWSSGHLITGGGGIAIGAGVSAGKFLQITDAANVNSLKGPGFEVGASAGTVLGPAFGLDFVAGLANKDGGNFPVNNITYKGLSFNAGYALGLPVEAHANATGTAGFTTQPWSSSTVTPTTPNSGNPFKPTIGPQYNSYK